MKLSTVIEQFTELKLALGNSFKNERCYLRIFLERVGDKALDDITEEEVHKFLLGSRLVPKTYHCRFLVINGIFKFAMARGYCSRLPLPKILPKNQSNFTPYIYSNEDLKCLIAATARVDRVDVVQSHPQIEPETLRVIILLLYGATLRISEALALNIEDVDLDQGVLTIHESKFYKTRIVPIGPALTAVLSKYASSRHSRKTSDRFLINRKGRELLKGSIQEKFSRVRKIAGVIRDQGLQPRLHDLRHTGAVHRFVAWYRDGKDVQKLLPLLSTYMGHSQLRDTQVYLTVIPEIMQSASFRFEQYAFGGVTP
jgi:integrase/recombinase XerD